MARQRKLLDVERPHKIVSVPLKKMRVSALAQRDQRQYRIDDLAAHLDLGKIGIPTVNLRDGVYWIIDGAHRVKALRSNGFGDESIDCQVYEGMSVEEEAEMFLGLNDNLKVNAMDKFKVGVVAGRDEDVDIEQVVRDLGLAVATGGARGSIGSVTALRSTYRKAGADGLRTSLTIIRDVYGDAGYRATLIDGVGLFVARYGNQVDVPKLKQRLKNQHEGAEGLMKMADRLRNASKAPRPECVAAAIVEIYNRARGVAKLETWWRADR